MSRRIAVVVFTVLTLFPGPSVAREHVVDAQEAWLSTPEALDDAAEMRAKLGLPSDRAYLMNLVAEGEYTLEWDIPLTAEEAQAVRMRYEGRLALDPVIDAFKEDGRAAGLWIEHHPGGVRLHAAVKGDAVGVRDKYFAQLPAGTDVAIHSADFSASELSDVRGLLEAQAEALLAEDVRITFLGEDPQLNRVVVGLDPMTETARRRVIAIGGGAVVTEHRRAQVQLACSGRFECPDPQKGGVRVYASDIDRCTSGFMGRKTGATNAGEWYVITAGHCLDPTEGSGIGVTWKHHLNAIGKSHQETMFHNTEADAGVIKMSAMDPFLRNNQVFAGGPTDIRKVDSRRKDANQLVGDPVCRGGASSTNWRCGSIIAANVSVWVQGRSGAQYRYHNQWMMDRPSMGGDSGGPVMYNFKAYGIVVAGEPGITTYSTIDRIAGTLQYRPCYTWGTNPCN
jgi:hypothetical protein